MRSKYNVSSNKSCRTYNDIVFDSEMEMKYYRDVILPKSETGEITAYELQKKFELQPKFKSNGKTIRAIDYIADFYVVYRDGSTEVVDVKGMPDKVAQIKKKMFLYKYPEQKYIWITYVNRQIGWVEYEKAQEMKKRRNVQ